MRKTNAAIPDSIISLKNGADNGSIIVEKMYTISKSTLDMSSLYKLMGIKASFTVTFLKGLFKTEIYVLVSYYSKFTSI